VIRSVSAMVLVLWAVAACSGSLDDPAPTESPAPVEIEVGRVPVPGGELYYETAGSGEPVVFVHGNAGDLRHWDLQFEAVADEFRVIRYDVRGFGRSTDPVPGVPFSHHDDLAAVLDHLGVERAHVAGWSMGSGIAIDFALAFPERTTSLISVGPWVNGFASDASREMSSQMGAVFRAGREEGSEAAVAAWVAAPFWIATVRDPEAGNRFRRIAAAQSFLPSSGPNPRVALRPPAVDRTEEIAAPTLIVTAEYDIPADVEVADLLERTVPNAQRVTMPGTGHLMHMERFDDFNSLVRDFVQTAAR